MTANQSKTPPDEGTSHLPRTSYAAARASSQETLIAGGWSSPWGDLGSIMITGRIGKTPWIIAKVTGGLSVLAVTMDDT